MKRSIPYIIIVIALLSCKSNNDSVLYKFDAMIAASNGVVIRFSKDDFSKPAVVTRVLNKADDISNLRAMLLKSTEGPNCNQFNGTMSFFNGTIQTGFLEFSTDATCPAFYLHYHHQVVPYGMTPACAMYLMGVQQGNNAILFTNL